MTQKIYQNAAAKQKAYRLRHGQKKKVPLEIRRGEALGASESVIRARKEGETWEEYHIYIQKSVDLARKRQAKTGGTVKPTEQDSSTGAKRGFGKEVEPEFTEEYYEIRASYEKELAELIEKQKGGKIKIK